MFTIAYEQLLSLKQFFKDLTFFTKTMIRRVGYQSKKLIAFVFFLKQFSGVIDEFKTILSGKPLANIWKGLRFVHSVIRDHVPEQNLNMRVQLLEMNLDT